MNSHCFRPPRGRTVCVWLAAAALSAGAGVSQASQSQSQSSGGYTLNWSSITAGSITHMRSSCYILSGSIGFQSAPNNSSIFNGQAGYVLYSGFWWSLPIANTDEIFFDGFEECN